MDLMKETRTRLTQTSKPEVLDMMNKNTAAQVNFTSMEQAITALQTSLPLHTWSKIQLVAVSKMLGLRTVGSSAMLRRRIQTKYDDIRSDDALICKDGITALDDEELRDAVRARGMNDTLELENQRQLLDTWIRVSKLGESALLVLSPL